MESIEDVGDLTKIIPEYPDADMGGSGSKSKVDQVRVSGLEKNDDDGSVAAAGGEPVAVAEIVVERTYDGNSSMDCVLDNTEKEKIGYENAGVCDRHSNGSDKMIDVEEGVNGVVGNDGNSKKSETACGDSKGGKYADFMKVNGSREDCLNLDVDEDEKEEKDGEKLEDDQDNQFHVGDLVWGKIRSHPWWPGQVYDPKAASEFALKSKQRDRLLVAFFGDGSWSWCLPSQLVPFVENFAGMSRKSSSRSFLNAVQSAIDEVGRVVESEMACNCVAKERKDGLARPVAENAGVKAGVLVPEVESHRISIHKYESKELLEKVRQFARTVSVGNPVDLTVLRSCLSAFYCFKGAYQLASYQEPLTVEGLEDKDNNVDGVSNDFSVPIEVPIVGPKDDDWQSSPTAGTINSPNSSGNKVFHKRKRKSVAELMGENKNTVEKPTSSRKRKKSTNGEAEETSNQAASSIGKTGKKRKVEVTESPEITNEGCSNAEKNGENKGPSSGKSKNIRVTDVKIPSDEAKEEPEMMSTPRERKKSKYLSPPYTTPIWRMGNLSSRMGSEVEHGKNNHAGGHTTESTVEQPTHEHVSESVEKTTVEKQSNSQLEYSDVSVDASPQRVKDDKNVTFPASDVYASVSQLLLKTRLAAVDPFYLSEEGSLDPVWAFVYALRSYTYLHGPNYKIYRKCKTRGKRKSGSSQRGNDGTLKRVSSSDPNASSGLKTEELLDASKSMKPAETSGAKSNGKQVDGKTLPCFVMEFAPDYPLPSKKEIVKLFGKFGNLRRKDVKINTQSHSIRMFYPKHADAEAAYKSAMSKCPFGFDNVTCRLLPSTSSRSGQPRPKASSPAKESGNKKEDDLISDARGIRQKAEIMTAILENYQSKFSSEDRSNLKEGMKNLMEQVEAMSDKVRVIAENASSS